MSRVGRRLVAIGGGRVEIESFDVPEPGPGEVLVRVNRSQVSAGSEKNGLVDQSRTEERRPLGYTTVGRVLASGTGRDEFKPGDRVLAFGSHGSHWLAGQESAGEMRSSIQRVEYDVTDEQAAFAVLGDVALHGVRRGQLQIDESVAIFVQGVVGQLVTSFCRLSGAYPVIAIDVAGERLDMARERGATHTIGRLEGERYRSSPSADGGRGAVRVPCDARPQCPGGLHEGDGGAGDGGPGG